MPTTPWIPLVAILVVALMSGTSALADDTTAKELPSLPEGLRKLIDKRHPGMRAIEASDVDSRSCGDFGGVHPGWVAADFTGDGRKDYAVLLVSVLPKEKKIFEGKEYTVHNLLLAIYVAQANGQFKEMMLDRREDLLPSNKGIKLHKEATVYDLDANRKVALRYSGMMFYSCEQFAWVYHWTGAQFSPIVVSR